MVDSDDDDDDDDIVALACFYSQTLTWLMMVIECFSLPSACLVAADGATTSDHTSVLPFLSLPSFFPQCAKIEKLLAKSEMTTTTTTTTTTIRYNDNDNNRYNNELQYEQQK